MCYVIKTHLKNDGCVSSARLSAVACKTHILSVHTHDFAFNSEPYIDSFTLMIMSLKRDIQ